MAKKKPTSSPGRPRPLGNETVLLCCRMAVENPPRAKLVVSHHAQLDHPERGIGAEYIILALRRSTLSVDRASSRYLDPPGVWSYRLLARLEGHPMRIVVSFDPSEPRKGETFSVRIVTAYFPNEPGGGLPREFRTRSKERRS